ncbi:hypothetical protein [Campylobacter ureolyticus]|uniref:hypothetical protein n=1 Tax=Campylobacter ureolyticus TaxID=827 RepID=UPI0022B4EA6B|nr:hypothetical protein [Campylobacter ureolyticus]MCZ6156942.1 hypothetical protein [Campylobacter ureolyticus]MCZ6168607.1 hypothetical protein [Campylobacter ureolyticus]
MKDEIKNLFDAFKVVKKIVPYMIEVSKKSNQSGIYLIFDSLEQINYQIDLVSFKILVQAKSLNDDNKAILPLIEKIRESFIKYDSHLLDNGNFSVESLGFDGALYIYEIKISFKIFRDVV